jgi:hypothetical protein
MRKSILAIAVVAILFSATIPAMGFLQSKTLPRTTVDDTSGETYGVRIMWGDGENERIFMTYDEYGLVDVNGDPIDYRPSHPNDPDDKAVQELFEKKYSPLFKNFETDWRVDNEEFLPDNIPTGEGLDGLLDLPDLPALENFSICDIIDFIFGG